MVEIECFETNHTMDEKSMYNKRFSKMPFGETQGKKLVPGTTPSHRKLVVKKDKQCLMNTFHSNTIFEQLDTLSLPCASYANGILSAKTLIHRP